MRERILAAGTAQKARRSSTMPRVPWSHFLSARSTSYLVAAVAAKSRRLPARPLLAILVALLSNLKLTKGYAATVNPGGEQEIHIAFEDEAEAIRVVQVVQAQPVASCDTAWARQWVFHMSEVTSDAIRAAMVTGGEIDER